MEKRKGMDISTTSTTMMMNNNINNEEAVTRPRKRVRFSQLSSLLLTTPKTSRELHSTWLTKAEQDQFKSNAIQAAANIRMTDTNAPKLMKHIAKSNTIIDVPGREVICGLEHLISPDVFKTLYGERRKTIARVLQVQHAQRIGICGTNPETTAKVSEINSSFSRSWSHRIGRFQLGGGSVIPKEDERIAPTRCLQHGGLQKTQAGARCA